ncbi:unnamed protein product, partial [Polarella glacialis]
VTSLLTYPERLAYLLLSDLAVAVQGIEGIETMGEHSLNEQLGPKIRQLVDHYEDQSNFPQLNSAMTTVTIGRDSSMANHQDSALSASRGSRKMKIYMSIAVESSFP